MIEPSLPIDTKQLLLFEEVYRTRSVSRAAERLGLAQPTVSIWLRELRRCCSCAPPRACCRPPRPTR
ncbi:helix-turn-helix domain-containing protein [Azotobacter beijerinckii]|nr:LysR family transcriptional regulator [Azotobacter beijerinckii]